MQTKKRFNHKNRRGPAPQGMKTCFVTKETYPRADMLRFVSAPGRIVCFDVARKLPGHGFWLKADGDILNQAITKRLFYKAAKGTVKIPEDLAEQVENALRTRCVHLLALCRKAGLLVFGFEAVKKALAAGTVVAAFEATDASARGQSKVFRPDDTFPVYTVLSRTELGQVAGMDEVVHVALLSGKLSDSATETAHQLNLLLGSTDMKG